VSGQQHAPTALNSRERHGTHCTGGLVGPRAGLEGWKISSPPGFDPGPSSPHSVAIPAELPGPPNITNPMYIQQLREMVPPPSQNTVGICKQITLLILYCISSRLITLPKFIDARIQVPNIFFILLIFSSSSILAFRYFFFLFPKCLLASRLTLFRLSTFLWLGSCNLCILACLYNYYNLFYHPSYK